VVELRQYTILHTIETSGPGGAETVLLHLASNLNPQRFRSLVVLTGEGWLRQQLLNRKIQHELVAWKAWYDFRLPRALVRLIKREGVDLIHSHLPDQNFYSCLAASWTNRPAIVTYHGPIELTGGSSFRKSLKLRYVRREAEVVVVVCHFVARMLEQAKFPPEKIACIYNGIETEQFASTPNGKLRKTLGLSKDNPLVGMVANVRQSKGYEFFIRAARKVVDAFPTARFLAVGDIDEMLGPNLHLLVEQLNLRDHFSFLGFRSDVPEILKDLDVFVLSSTSEGFPLVVLEAMAVGKPAVVTRCGGPEEVIDDGKTGFLVPPSDAEALAARICQILADRRLAADLGQSAQARVRRDFSLGRMLREYEVLYERCLA
jgi:glycosyltransferase involved in cell wall biosynthesis